MRDERNEELLRLRILYVDDNAINLRIVAELLGSVGANVSTALSGAEGLRLLGVGGFDLVLTDIHMPEMSGFEFLAQVRASVSGAPPVIALTADVSRREAEYLALGFSGFVAKPVLLRPLLVAILGGLQIRPAAAASQRSSA